MTGRHGRRAPSRLPPRRPQVDYPTIQIVTFYPGASPETMASSVTTPLERQSGQLPGLRQMTSTSSSGASLITLQFALDLSIDVAEQQVQAAINTVATERGALVPLGRVATPEDIADVIAFLLGPDARYVSGHDLVVDGGISGNHPGRLPGLSRIARGS